MLRLDPETELAILQGYWVGRLVRWNDNPHYIGKVQLVGYTTSDLRSDDAVHLEVGEPQHFYLQVHSAQTGKFMVSAALNWFVEVPDGV